MFIRTTELVNSGHSVDVCGGGSLRYNSLVEFVQLVGTNSFLALQKGLPVLIELELLDHNLGGMDTNFDSLT